MSRFLHVLTHPNRLLAAIWARMGNNISDESYLKTRFKLIFGKELHLGDPQTFNEKLNWLKIYNRRPEYVSLVDKAEVKNIVSEKLKSTSCEVIPTYGIWDSFDEIDFNSLPNQFVLKSTNGGGGTGVIVCRDKQEFDKTEAKHQLEASLNKRWKIEREWVYRDITPRIIAEKLMQNNDGSQLVDWKLFCFNGEPKLLFYASDRYTKGEPLKFDWYDMNLNHLSIQSKGYPNANKKIEMFPEWETMKEVARTLSKGIPHVRVDLYLINHTVYFGELTFFHDGGMVPIYPEEWDYTIGSWLTLPPATRE